MNITGILASSIVLFSMTSSVVNAQAVIDYSGEPARVTGNMASGDVYKGQSSGSQPATFVSTNGEKCVVIRGGETMELDLVPPCTVVKHDVRRHNIANDQNIYFYVLGQQPNNAALVQLPNATDAFGTLCKNGEIAGNRTQPVLLDNVDQFTVGEAIDFDPVCASMAYQQVEQQQ